MRRMVGVVLVAAGCGAGGAGGDLVFIDANNYSFDGELTLETIEVAPAVDATVDWSAITTDLRGRAFDGTVDQILLVEFVLPKDEILSRSVNNDLFQEDSQSQFLFDPAPDATSAALTEFEIIGNPFDPTDPGANWAPAPDRNWLISLAGLPDGRIDVLMSAFVDPTDGVTEAEVPLTDSSSSLTFDVDLHSMPAIEADEDASSYTLDWGDVSTDVNGKSYDNLLADELLIAHYADAVGPEDIEEVFLRLDSEATSLFRMSAFGRNDAELSDATDADGNAFSGFTTDGVWLVGMACSTCTSPVPFLIGVVDVN